MCTVDYEPAVAMKYKPACTIVSVLCTTFM